MLLTPKALQRYRMVAGEPREALQSFSLSQARSVSLLALAQNGCGSTFVLADDSTVYELDAQLLVVAKAALGATAIGRQSQLAADDAGRVYITSSETSTVSVFDLRRGMYTGRAPTNNCPIRVTKPVDAVARRDRLYVLAEEPSGYRVSVFGIPLPPALGH